jgi:hypothetical protein
MADSQKLKKKKETTIKNKIMTEQRKKPSMKFTRVEIQKQVIATLKSRFEEAKSIIECMKEKNASLNNMYQQEKLKNQQQVDNSSHSSNTEINVSLTINEAPKGFFRRLFI